MKKFNILFTSAGRRVALVKAFRSAMQQLSLEGKIVTADCKLSAQAHFAADAMEIVPRVDHPDYLNELLNICSKYKINLVVPLIDPELQILSDSETRFRQAGITLLSSSSETNSLCIDKVKTHQFFSKIGIKTPEILNIVDVLNNSDDSVYPLFLKPRFGSGSVGAVKIENKEQLEFHSKMVTNPILQEYISGDEYSIDILTDKSGKVISVVPRLRLEVRSGEICKGVTVKDARLISGAKFVAESLPGTFGCLTVQCFVTSENEIVYTEINPRFGGGIPLTIQAGANFPLWIIQMVQDKNPETQLDSWEDGLVMLRYDDAIFTKRQIIMGNVPK
ncbi:MAG: ATP-grasp domain-containing protein [Candidatus Riflebacteria bacterium]|nr:ATP-grasp domain-containing protein [Candidatus Riflebacteria bacterium]